MFQKFQKIDFFVNFFIKNFVFQLKMFLFHSELYTENRLQILVVNEMHPFKNISLGGLHGSDP